MKQRYFLLTGLVLIAGLTAAGCAHYKITHPLEAPLDTTASWSIGEFRDGLPPDTDEEDKPDEFNLQKLKDFLREELEERNIFQADGLPASDPLEVAGTILEFKKGSGFVRALIGFGVGNAVLTTELEVRNRVTGETLFSGNFKGEVSDWTVSGEECFKRVAKDFAKALDKDLKRAIKGD